eukprot:jgi/Mesen1/8753/ME000521S08090
MHGSASGPSLPIPAGMRVRVRVKGPPAFFQTGVMAPKPAAPHASHILTLGNAQHRHEDGGLRAAALPAKSSAPASERAAPGGALSKQGSAAPVPGGSPGSAGGVQGKWAIDVQLPLAEDANHLLK